MFRKNKPAKDGSPRMTKEEFERRLRESLDANPGMSIDEVVRRVKSGTDMHAPPGKTPNGEQGTTTSGRGKPGQLPKQLLYALLIFLLVLALAFAAIVWKSWQVGGEPPTPPAATDAVITPSEIRFDPNLETTVAPGETISLPLTVLAGERPAAGVTLSFAVNPPEGGAITPTAITDTGGATSVNFTAGNSPQPVTITAWADANSEIRAEHSLTIAPQPTLTVSFKDAPSASDFIRVGEKFTIGFRIDNTGLVAAENPRLTVNTPPGLAVVEVDADCDNIGTGTVSCELGGIPADQKATKFITYRADGPATVSFTPDVYSVSYNGASAPIRGTATWTVNIEAPRAATVTLTAVPPELGADGVSTARLDVEVKDQWAEPYNGPAPVGLTIAREGAEDVTTPLSITVSCRTEILTTLTHEGEGDTAQTENLPAATSLQATAYNPDTAQLFVIASLTGGTEARGWVSWPTDTAQRTVSCPEGDVTALPAEPPQETAAAPTDGLILLSPSQTFLQGSRTFIYQAGTLPGVVQITAHLLDENGNAIGEPAPATITLLETGSLGRSSHIFNSPAGMISASPGTMILFSMPTGTPLELYPPDDNAPNARKVALRVWVPADAVGQADESGHATLVSPMPEARSVSAGPEPPAVATAAAGEAQWQEGAAGQQVTVLEERGGFKLVRITGWIPADVLAAGE